MSIDFEFMTTAAFSLLADESITYSRGSDSVNIKAIRANEDQVLSEDGGVYSIDGSCVFHVEKENLVLSGTEITPSRGDTVTDSWGQVYDVSPESTIDNLNLAWLIKCSRVDK